MDFVKYKKAFIKEAKNRAIPDELVGDMIDYASILVANNTPIIFDQQHFSELVGYRHDFILSVSNSANIHYKEYLIPKRNGKVRIINEPLPSLKEIQGWMLNNILTPTSSQFVSSVAKAYMPNNSVRDNARFHRGQKLVLNIDLVDFFGSIKFEQVFSVFRRLGYCSPVSTLMSNLCLLNGVLPQGSPTSPMLSNLVFQYYDVRIFEFCRDRNIRYTRYADDLTFSGNLNAGEVICFLRKLFKKTNFVINDSKTRVTSQGSSQRVTGLVVNEKIQTTVEYRRKVRQEVYFLKKFGPIKHLKKIKWEFTTVQYIYHLLGKVNYIIQINPKDESAKKYYTFLADLLKRYK